MQEDFSKDLESLRKNNQTEILEIKCFLCQKIQLKASLPA
jgi:hypothetical protein